MTAYQSTSLEMRADRDQVAGRALSPRAFRPFGVEAVVLGAPTLQEGLVRREGVAVWRRLPQYAPVFDRAAAGREAGDLLTVRVVVATTRARDRALRVPALGERAALAAAAAAGPPPAGPWLLLVDEGPGETWLYLGEEPDPAAVLGSFLGRRGRTDFERARRRSRAAGIASAALLAGLVLAVYSPALGWGRAGTLAGVLLVVAAVALLVRVRPR